MCTTVDINECEGYNDCHQICINTNGSYYCSCDIGFMLAADSRTCQGTLLNAIIIFLHICVYCWRCYSLIKELLTAMYVTVSIPSYIKWF